MPVLTIKAKSAAPAQRDRLLVAANEMASDLLEAKSDRVLVVYDKQAASIYYERGAAKTNTKLS